MGDKQTWVITSSRLIVHQEEDQVNSHTRKNFVDVKNLNKHKVYMGVMYLHLTIIILQQKMHLNIENVTTSNI